MQLGDIPHKHFVVSTMKDVFEQVSMRNVINFIKEINFYNLLKCLLPTFYCSSIALILHHFLYYFCY